MTLTPLLSAMNCSLSAPMTFSIEVEPLVETLPLSFSSVCCCGWSLLVLSGAVVLLPQPASSERLITAVSTNASVFFIFHSSFHMLILDFLRSTTQSITERCKMQKPGHVKLR